MSLRCQGTVGIFVGIHFPWQITRKAWKSLCEAQNNNSSVTISDIG